MREARFDDRVREAAPAIVDVDDPLPHGRAACKRDEPRISVEPRVDDELSREPGVDRTNVAYGCPNVLGRRLDRHFFVNGCHLFYSPFSRLISWTWPA